MWTIEKFGFAWYACKDCSKQSIGYTSANQAGAHILRVAGKDAYHEAYECWVAEYCGKVAT